MQRSEFLKLSAATMLFPIVATGSFHRRTSSGRSLRWNMALVERRNTVAVREKVRVFVDRSSAVVIQNHRRLEEGAAQLFQPASRIIHQTLVETDI